MPGAKQDGSPLSLPGGGGEIRGIPFCGACASRQDAYFAIGELTQEAHGFRYGPLVGALESISVAEQLEAISRN